MRSNHGARSASAKPAESEFARPMLERRGGRPKARRPVHRRAAADAASLQYVDRLVVALARGGFLVELRIGLALRACESRTKSRAVLPRSSPRSDLPRSGFRPPWRHPHRCRRWRRRLPTRDPRSMRTHRSPSSRRPCRRGTDRAAAADAGWAQSSAGLERRRPGVADRRPGVRVAVPGAEHELVQRAVGRAQQRQTAVAPMVEEGADRCRRRLRARATTRRRPEPGSARTTTAQRAGRSLCVPRAASRRSPARRPRRPPAASSGRSRAARRPA